MELIKLKVKEEAAKGIRSQEIVNSFIKSCIQLDTTIIEPLINEEQYFDELDKYRFLAFLKKQFDSAKADGLKEMKMKRGECGLCELGHPTYEFYGLENIPRFAYIINTKDGKVLDIFNCNASSGWSTKN